MSLGVPQLKIASTYVNNLLLARGLLRNGKAIDFAALGSDEHRKGGGKEQDAKRSAKNAERAVEVINLVHDLILRRDRETDQLNALSETLADLRSGATSQSTQLERLKSQNSDLTRQLNTTQSSLKSAHAALQSAESTAKTLKEELTKVKTTLAQVRMQCANDVRKRDVQIQRLKGHLSSSQRGSNGRLVPPTCTISGVGALGKAGSQGSANGLVSSRGDEEAPPSLEDAEYSLKQETTDFLTQLSQNLSDENDTLITLVRSTLATLRELQNLPPTGSITAAIPSKNDSEITEDGMVHVVHTSYQVLSTDLEYVLTNLRSILTNASFVSIDEVYTRDEEIHRLRDGWERMETRWREAVEMMTGWRERMERGGGTVNLEELRLGLGLGDGLELLADLPASSSPMARYDEDRMDMPNLPEDEPSFVPERESLVLRTRGDADDHLLDDIEQPSSSPPGSPPISAALKESTGNVKALPQDQTNAFSKAVTQQENAASLDLVESKEDGLKHRISSPTRSGGLKHTAGARIKRDKDADGRSNSSLSPSTRARLINARLESPRARQPRSVARDKVSHFNSEATARTDTEPSPPSPEPPLTVEEKLHHAEVEARRLSGDSLSIEACPTDEQNDDDEEARTTQEHKEPQSEEEETEQQYSTTTNPAATNPPPRLQSSNVLAVRPSSSASNTTNKSAEPKNHPTTAPTPTSNRRHPQPPKSRVTASTAASRAASLPHRRAGATTYTTRIPTKPAAPDAAVSAHHHVPPGRRAREARETADAAGPVKREQPSVEARIGRSRRKRKSTLSPEELEELMGLRRRAEEEGAAAAAARDEIAG